MFDMRKGRKKANHSPDTQPPPGLVCFPAMAKWLAMHAETSTKTIFIQFKIECHWDCETNVAVDFYPTNLADFARFYTEISLPFDIIRRYFVNLLSLCTNVAYSEKKHKPTKYAVCLRLCATRGKKRPPHYAVEQAVAVDNPKGIGMNRF